MFSTAKLIETLIKFLIAVHILVIVLIALPNTIFHNHLPSFLLGYANQIGIRNSWNMFAPDPAPEQKLQLQYFDDFKNPEPLESIEVPQGKLYGVSAIRKFYMYNYFLASDERIFNELEPVLCAHKNSKGHWTLKTWGKFDRQQFALSRDMLMDCSGTGHVKSQAEPKKQD